MRIAIRFPPLSCFRLLLSAHILILVTDAVISGEVGEIAATNSSNITLNHSIHCQFDALNHTDLRLAPRTGVTSRCVNGRAISNDRISDYPCKNIDLLSFLPLRTLYWNFYFRDDVSANDLWGWTHTETGREFAIVGIDYGTAFVEISNPVNPLYLGILPATRFKANEMRRKWHDVKTYEDHAYIVSELTSHGMQVFDLTRLLDVTSGPKEFFADAMYTRFGAAHNIAINEDTGYAYAVGTNTCEGGLHMIDVRKPKTSNPSFAGCYSLDGYTHDVQCVVYEGKDLRFYGQEICFAANEDSITIVNVEDKNIPYELSKTTYGRATYTHQGWLTNDHRYFIFDDEKDEKAFKMNTASYVMNVDNLRNPRFIGAHYAETKSVDHNQYVKSNYVYQANYEAGLRILKLGDLSKADLMEVAYFDIVPGSDEHDTAEGAWSVYPYFESGTVIVSGIEEGLYILRPTVGLIFTDSFSTDKNVYSRFLRRTPKPLQPRGGVGKFSGSFAVPTKKRGRTVKEFVNIDVRYMQRIILKATVGLKNMSRGTYTFKMQVTFDTGQAKSGRQLFLGSTAHLEYRSYAKSITVPKNANFITEIRFRSTKRESKNTILLDSVSIENADRSEQTRAKKANLFKAG